MPTLLFWNRFTNLNDWSAYLGGIFPHLLSWKRDIREQQKHREEKQDLCQTHHSYSFYNQDPEATEKTTYFVFYGCSEHFCPTINAFQNRGVLQQRWQSSNQRVSSQDRPLWDLYYQYHFSDKWYSWHWVFFFFLSFSLLLFLSEFEETYSTEGDMLSIKKSYKVHSQHSVTVPAINTRGQCHENEAV